MCSTTSPPSTSLKALSFNIFKNSSLISSLEFVIIGELVCSSSHFFVSSKLAIVQSLMRTANAAAKPCQGDSSGILTVTGSIYTSNGEPVVDYKPYSFPAGVVVVPDVKVEANTTCSYSTDIYKDIMKAQLKNIKKDGYTRFQHQEQYKHVGPEVTRSQEGKRSQDDDKRLCLLDDLKEFKITFMSSQRYKPNPKD
ncbi:hypothetical protein Tco_0278269 [Tanacetum coccineum]